MQGFLLTFSDFCAKFESVNLLSSKGPYEHGARKSAYKYGFFASFAIFRQWEVIIFAREDTVRHSACCGV
jgi:hypothetical protein